MQEAAEAVEIDSFSSLGVALHGGSPTSTKTNTRPPITNKNKGDVRIICSGVTVGENNQRP